MNIPATESAMKVQAVRAYFRADPLASLDEVNRFLKIVFGRTMYKSRLCALSREVAKERRALLKAGVLR